MTPLSRFSFCLLLSLGRAAAESAPPKIFSPNPPACAQEVADLLCDITDAATGIVHDTVICSGIEGWHHRERVCAAHVITQVATLAGAAGDALALSFDCFNSNQACGQSITSIIAWILQAAGSLVGAADFCHAVPPEQQAIAGFNCYRKIWHTIQRVLKVSKFVDVAVSTCSPEGPHDVLPSPESFDSNSSDATGENMGADGQWSGIAEAAFHPNNMKDVQVAPVERRLREATTNSSNREQFLAQVQDLQSKIAKFTNGTLEEDELKDMEELPGSPEEAEKAIKDMLDALVLAFPAAAPSQELHI